jgi:hypothetical protein
MGAPSLYLNFINLFMLMLHLAGVHFAREIFEMIAAESQRARDVALPRLKKSIARLRKVLENRAQDDATLSFSIRWSPRAGYARRRRRGGRGR